MTKLTLPAAGFALLASVMTSQSAIAATDTWSWRFDDTACGTTSDATCNGHTSTNNGDTWTQNTSSGSGPDLTLQAWSSTNDGTPNTMQTGILRHYSDSGFGIVNRVTGSGDPEHAFGGDRNSISGPDTFENMDAVLLSFDDVVTLDQVTTGWSHDSDFSLLAWTGADTGPGSLAGDSYADLIAGGSGWTMLGHYYSPQDSSDIGGPGGDDEEFSVNAGGVSSSYYLLSVLNPELNTGCTGSNNGSRYCAGDGWGGNDYFKMLALGGTTTTPDDPGTEVPIPATAFLLLAALPLVRLGQRRKA